MTHVEWVKGKKLSRKCTCHNLNYGGECFNCGYPGEKTDDFWRGYRNGHLDGKYLGISLETAKRAENKDYAAGYNMGQGR
jgi:hypothetical protein